jgi:hypothetical protein
MTTKDWTGNSKAIYSCHGASNHSETEREANDYYATPPSAVEMLLKLEDFSKTIMEPACGQGHIAEILKSHGYTVCATDLIDRGYGVGNVDFFSINDPTDMDIITNPPYAMANVLNVQSSKEMLLETLNQIKSVLKDDGEFICNFPISPRKMEMNGHKMEEVLTSIFPNVSIVGGTKSAPIWKVVKSKFI